MTCLSAVVTLSPIVVFSLSRTIHSLRPLPSLPLLLLFGCTPICIGTRSLSVYCCVLVISSHLSTTRDSYAFPNIHIGLDVVDHSLRCLTLLCEYVIHWYSCVGMSSLRLQDNTFLRSPTNLGSHSLTNCLLPANSSLTLALRNLCSVCIITSAWKCG